MVATGLVRYLPKSQEGSLFLTKKSLCWVEEIWLYELAQVVLKAEQAVFSLLNSIVPERNE
jgi:hypothetical protein